MKNTWNIAVVGASVMAKLHMDGVNAHPKATLYAVCDTDPEALAEAAAEKHPVKAVSDYRALVNDPAVDAAVLVVPDKLHPEMTAAFLRAGKAVLCEKPMALTAAECAEMMRVEKETGGRLMIGQICRCTPGFIAGKKLVDEGKIGELFFVESEYAHNYDHARGKNDWRVDPDRHCFIGGACHAVDLLRWIAGDPTEVTAYANHKCLPDWPVDDCTVAIYRFPDGVIGKIFCSIGCRRSYTMRTVLYGTRGTVICDNTSPEITLYSMDEPFEDGTVDYTRPHVIPVDINNHNATAEIEAFVDALVTGSPMPVSSEEGAKTVACAAATVASTRSGAPVKIAYFD